MSAFDVTYAFQRGYDHALIERKGKGWEEVSFGPGLFDFYFVCRDCGASLPASFACAPKFCPYCGKEHG